MSWQTFADEVGSKMREASWESTDEWASFFTQKYDECIKRGKDIITKNSVQKGNTELMKTLLQVSAVTGLSATTPAFYSQFLSLLGKACIGYWSGAVLTNSSIPLIPCPGTITNIQTTSCIVTNPGIFGSAPTPPITDVADFLNLFIGLAQVHLTTVQGICNCISQYPPPVPPGPAVLPWVGYIVQPGQLSREQQQQNEEQQFQLNEAEKAEIKQDINEAEIYKEDIATDQSISDLDKAQRLESAEEFIGLNETKLAENANVSVDVYDDVDEIVESMVVDDDLVERIKAFAKADIGIMENAVTSNYGGKVTEYLRTVGINGPAYWCAAFVSYIWKKAGAKSPNSASCEQWRRWAIRNGVWSTTPQPGAAVLYFDKQLNRCHHIGICIACTPDGERITTIEGNTSGGGFNRNGVGVFKKNPRKKAIIGYVIPKKK